MGVGYRNPEGYADPVPYQAISNMDKEQNYNFVRNILKKESFGSQKISKVKTSDAKLFLIKM